MWLGPLLADREAKVRAGIAQLYRVFRAAVRAPMPNAPLTRR